MATHAYVEATDGQRKRWMFNSKEYELPAGTRKLLPLEVAEQARTFFSPWSENGRAESTVEVTPVEGEMEMVEVGAGPQLIPCHLCGAGFALTDLSAHVAECGAGNPGQKGAAS